MGSVGDYWRESRDHKQSLPRVYCITCGRRLPCSSKKEEAKLPSECWDCDPDEPYWKSQEAKHDD